MPDALLFDRDEVEVVDDWANLVDGLRRSSILWIDVGELDEEQVADLVEALELSSESERRLATREAGRPQVSDFGSYVHVSASAPARDDHGTEVVRIECLVAERWIVTVHDGPVSVIEDFRERASGSGDTGRLNGLEFLASLLEWVLNGYLDAFEDVERALEEFDARAMEGKHGDMDDELRRLVALRREVGGLRRALVSHRELFLALTRPELESIASSDSAQRFTFLRSRLEDVVQAARDSRESVVGSFDVLIARTEQRTNEIMKVLTLVTVLLLPGALIAGVMGMNFKIGLFETGWYFWIIVALMAVIAFATLLAARARDWI